VRTEAGNGGGLKPRITSRRPLRYCQKGTVKFSSAHIEVVSYLVKMTEAVGGRLAQQGTGAASRWRNSAESSCALRHGTPSPAPGARNYTMLDPFAMDWIPVLIRSCDTDWDYVRVGLLAVVEGDCDYCHYFPSVLKIPENSVSRRPVDVAYRVEGISLRMLLNNIPNQENTRGILSAEHSEQYARLGTKLKRDRTRVSWRRGDRRHRAQPRLNAMGQAHEPRFSACWLNVSYPSDQRTQHHRSLERFGEIPC